MRGHMKVLAALFMLGAMACGGAMASDEAPSAESTVSAQKLPPAGGGGGEACGDTTCDAYTICCQPDAETRYCIARGAICQ